MNDGSSDESGIIFSQWARLWPRTQLLNQHHSGLAASRNRGARLARSSYTMFLDSDDILNPLGVLVVLFMLVESGGYIARGEEVTHPFGLPVVFPKPQGRSHWRSAENEILRGLGGTLRFIYSRQALGSGGLVYPEQLFFAEDLVFALALAQRYPSFIDVPSVIYSYTTHRPQQMTADAAERRCDGLVDSLLAAVEYLQESQSSSKLRANFAAIVWWYSVRGFSEIGNPSRSALRNRLSEVSRHAHDSLDIRRMRALRSRARLLAGLLRARIARLNYWPVRSKWSHGAPSAQEINPQQEEQPWSA